MATLKGIHGFLSQSSLRKLDEMKSPFFSYKSHASHVSYKYSSNSNGCSFAMISHGPIEKCIRIHPLSFLNSTQNHFTKPISCGSSPSNKHKNPYQPFSLPFPFPSKPNSNPVKFHHSTFLTKASQEAIPPSPVVINPPPSKSLSTEDFIQERELLLELIPPFMREALENHPMSDDLLEIVLDLGRMPMARFPSGDWNIADTVVTVEDLEYAVSKVGEFGGDNRAGIDRTLHRISAIRNRSGKIVGLTCRVGRAISGSAEMVRDLVASGNSLLLMGPPGVGKTTAIREIARLLADECLKRVVIIDTSNEIGGDGDIPHSGIGRARRMQVPKVEMQHEVMIEAVENHMPQTIVIDEIGTELEAMAASTIAQRGVQLVGTAHGMTIENLMKNPSLQALAGGIQSVTLGDEEARRRGVQKSVLERSGPPVFACAVEMISRSEWRVHRSLSSTVDSLLAGKTPYIEIRRMNNDGNIVIGTHREMVSPSSPSSNQNKNGELVYSIYSDDDMDSGDEDDDSDTYSKKNNDNSMKEGQIWKKGDGVLQLYLYQVTESFIEQVVEVMNLENKVVITNDISSADAVIALRSKLKQNTWVRGIAKFRQLPIFVIKSNTMAQMVRALRAMFGIESLGESFQLEKNSTKYVTGKKYFGEGEGEGEEEEDEKGLKFQAVGNKSTLEDDIDALEEARLAIEQIVIPKSHPVELLPRNDAVLEIQKKLIEGYDLVVEKIGVHPNCRIRILPQTSKPSVDKTKLVANDYTSNSKMIDDDMEQANRFGSGISVKSLPVLGDP